ncbi:MAG: DEAD/DEAH box helicase family protein, partial [bacterium]|nr:DEAD/DEAH box helicase family protein [bacterium]
MDVATHIRDWNVDGCWRWEDWPDRERVLPGSSPLDHGIDLVARRRDGAWIAIQAKSRRLDESGQGRPVTARELATFFSLSANRDVWAERWVTVNGAFGLSGHAPDHAAAAGVPLKVVNVAQAVESQRAAFDAADTEACPHCDTPNSGGGDPEQAPIQTRSCMQREAVATAVERLRANEMADEDNIPRGEARGRIILPCGTGKTRIALRIVEELAFPGELSVVLCPSVALVAQIRREFLQHTNRTLRVMAVCSDKGVAANEERVANSDDATVDRGLATTEEIRGCPVTTDPDEIADWIRQRRDGTAAAAVSVIFGTYQSARRVSEALRVADAADGFKVLICDEAHRTAGIRRRRRTTAVEDRLREFTLCHDRDAFPATYRVYQTATPRTYGDAAPTRAEFVVREMHDQDTFGVELFRRSYIDAVRNGWLSDYRIVAMAVGGEEATAIANELVREADEEAKREAEAAAARGITAQRRARRAAARLPTTGDYLKGMAFALAMGGAARDVSGGPLRLSSCIGFLNTIARSRTMTKVLQSEAVREWVAEQADSPAAVYRLEHLDASSPVAARDEAKRRLAAGSGAEPHGVFNVGIFGEGTDSPTLSAVAFLEPRKSPIDVVQAVGRAMRRAEGKELGYIVVPVVIPAGENAEQHLARSDRHEGWQELGAILLALRAHDSRIEDELAKILTIQLPAEPPPQETLRLRTAVALGRSHRTSLEYATVTGSREHAEDLLRAAIEEDRRLLDYDNTEPLDEGLWQDPADEPTAIIVHAERPDGSTITRGDTVPRRPPTRAFPLGRVNARQTKRRAVQVSRGQRGRDVPDPAERERQRAERAAARQAAYEGHIQGMLLDLTGTLGDSITMNLLEKSGLTSNRVQRDLNLLDATVSEAARYIHDESALAAALDTHFLLDDLSEPKRGRPRADGATTAALLWMNAAMLHQRIHAGGWLGRTPVHALADIKASPRPEDGFTTSWNAITRQDFLPVIEPAVEALDAARYTGRLGGLRRALRHIAAEAEQIAETYADMGVDHAGALFNKVMGDQSSDGAFFTRPVAATITARLAFYAVDPDNTLDWSNPNVWRQHKTVDLACGSGTLLTAAMTEMKRRATVHGADRNRLAQLQKVAVEETLKGLDFNEVSLQLAATQLMSGNTDVKYRRMGLHRMPYGPQPDGSVAVGTLELFGRQDIVNAGRLFDDAATSTRIRTGAEHSSTLEGPEMDKAVEAVTDARIVIMNPPFTNRSKMGQKFPKHIQQALRRRLDTLEGFLETADRRLSEFLDKNSLRPRFAALADLCLNREQGVFATVIPTIALTNPSGLPERLELAERFHIHTILTHMGVADVNFSQSTHREMNESIVVMRRHMAPPPPKNAPNHLGRVPAAAHHTAGPVAGAGTRARAGGVRGRAG